MWLDKLLGRGPNFEENGLMARQAVLLAIREANEERTTRLDEVHLFRGLQTLLPAYPSLLEELRQHPQWLIAEEKFGPKALPWSEAEGHNGMPNLTRGYPLSRALRKLLCAAEDSSQNRGASEVSLEDLLIALFGSPNDQFKQFAPLISVLRDRAPNP